jgi:hypothetical protein
MRINYPDQDVGPLNVPKMRRSRRKPLGSWHVTIRVLYLLPMSFPAPVLSTTTAFVKPASHFFLGHGSFRDERRREAMLPAIANEGSRFRPFFGFMR